MKKPSFLWLSPILTAVGMRFGIDAHYFAKNSVLMLISQGIGIVRGIVTGYLVARLFSKDMYGEYQFIASIAGMLSLLTLPGFATAVARSWSRNEGFLLGRIHIYQLVASLIGSAILLGSIPFLASYGRQELWPLFVAAAILFPLAPIATVRFGSYAIGRSRFDLTLKANIIWSIMMVIATLAVVLFHQSSLFIYIVNASIPSLVYLAMSRKAIPPPDPDGKNTKAITRYCLQLTIASLPNDLSSYLDKLLISHYFGLEQLAAFSVAILIPEQGKQMVKQLMPVSFARQAVMNDVHDARRKLAKVVTIGTLIFAVGIIAYWALSWWALPLLFPKYELSAILTISNASAAILIFMPATLFYQYLEAQKMVRQLQWTQWISATVFSISLLLLIPSFGVLGAVMSRGIFRMTSVTMAWWFVMFGKLHRPS